MPETMVIVLISHSYMGRFDNARASIMVTMVEIIIHCRTSCV